jgi:hypothetical protein
MSDKKVFLLAAKEPLAGFILKIHKLCTYTLSR